VTADGASDCAFSALTADRDRDTFPIFKPYNAALERVAGQFGPRIAHDDLPGELIKRANWVIEALSSPFERPTLKRDLAVSAQEKWKHLADNDPVPERHPHLKTVRPYATAAFLVRPGQIRLGVAANDEARHNLSSLPSGLLKDIVDVDHVMVSFCGLVDDRPLKREEAAWWLPIRELWRELKAGDHALAFYQPRIFELISMEGNLVRIWGADFAARMP
jgi:hypothetical protein